MSCSLITGITGQDGSYLAEQLLARGDSVHGIVRRSSQFNRNRIEPLREAYPTSLHLHYADLHDTTALRRIIVSTAPEELYHLAGQSHVGLSFEIPESTLSEVTNATLSILEICKDQPSPPRILIAGSSEIFGAPVDGPQTEETAHRPTSPYGCAKSCALHLGRVYREAFGLFVSGTIAYNHESVRRGPNFVTKKITSSVARIAQGSDEIIRLGNLDASRDWGFAPDYVEAMTRILGADQPDEFLLATGTSTTVRQFATAAFKAAGQQIEFEGTELDEIGRVNGRKVLTIDPRFFRPVDSTTLVGDAGKARRLLGWEPQTSGAAVAEAMVKDEISQSDGGSNQLQDI